MGLSLQNVNKIVGREIHLKDINLDLASGSRNVILGRTLSGKTSLLRIMAGLDRPTSGFVQVDGKDVTRVSVRKRQVAMVYQQFINYPSLNVFNNIASPLKLSGMGASEIDRRVRETAEMLHLDSLLDRLPAELSGGQQQRTAIARALVKDADLLLLDEPLVNLDYKLREELRVELQEIFKQRKAVVVYTTTEPTEALLLGGNIVVMDEGRILQDGSTPHTYHNPVNTKVAEIFSDPPINFLKGRVNGDRIRVGENITLALTGHMAGLASGSYLFGVRANHLCLGRSETDTVEIRAKVELSEINGSETFIHVMHDGTKMVIQEDGIHSRRIGSEILFYTKPGAFFVYDKSGNLVASPGMNALNT